MAAEAQSITDVSFLLYDFAPFLSVAMAINFVSSFWGQLKNKSTNNLDRNVQNLVTDLNAVYTSGDCEKSDSVGDFKQEAENYKRKLNKISNISTILGVLVVCILFFLLALIGFKPKFTLSFYEAIAIIFFSIFPSTSLRILGIKCSKKYVGELTKTSTTIKKAAKSAIQDNEKSAYEQQ